MSYRLASNLNELKLSPFTDVSAVPKKHERVTEGFHSGKLLSLEFRKQQLRNLYFAIQDNEELLKQALQRDLHRAPAESEILELNLLYAEINVAISNLDKWAADEPLSGDLKLLLAGPVLRRQAYGTVLIIAPWNYPYLCSLGPLVGALAAGNSVIMKPSEMVPHAAEVTVRLLEKALDPSIFQYVLGGAQESTALLDLRFDKIIMTGSCNVGRIVAAAAAKHLTPVALELGGKSPTFVSSTANLAVSAKRIAWGKLLNAGQTCIAPDYVIVERSVKDKFVKELESAIRKLYPNLTKDSSDYAHIVNDRLYERLDKLVSSSKGKVAFQWGKPDAASRFYPPTVVTNISSSDPLMKEELFAPVLPVIEVEDIEHEGVNLSYDHDSHPLALYIFTGDKKQADRITAVTRSGAVLVNDVLMHGGSHAVPFGGVGTSGIGRYHGKFGFDEFSHPRPVLNQPFWSEAMLKSRYTPYRPGNSKRLRFMSVPRVWFPRSGPVRQSLLSRVLSKWWLVLLVIAGLVARARL